MTGDTSAPQVGTLKDGLKRGGSMNISDLVNIAVVFIPILASTLMGVLTMINRNQTLMLTSLVEQKASSLAHRCDLTDMQVKHNTGDIEVLDHRTSYYDRRFNEIERAVLSSGHERVTERPSLAG